MEGLEILLPNLERGTILKLDVELVMGLDDEDWAVLIEGERLWTYHGLLVHRALLWQYS
jgi:hypothetical protein